MLTFWSWKDKMKQVSNMKEKGSKKRLSKSALVVIIGLIIIAIPVLVFAYILISAAMQTGSPVIGSRFDNDLNPKITSADISAVKTDLEKLPNVEKVDIVLQTAQFRVNIDTKDDISKEAAEELANSAYDTVNRKLPVNTYFTINGTMKMYDLAVNVYNKIEEDSDSMIYYLLTKNSNMEKASLQLVSEPVDAQLASELRGEGEQNDDIDEDDVDDQEGDNE